MDYYALPAVRCRNCNKPIAHLYNDYQMLTKLGHDPLEVFNTLDVTKYCCKKEFFAHKIPLTKAIDAHVMDVKKYTPAPRVLYDGVEFLQREIENEELICIPINIKPGNYVKKLNETLYVSYLAESTYLAQ